ncbi:hypothetical protein KGP36_02810 [Patescibacteria group bacterium]|nr:hypothetical protein [Patescibacteria group bacterium]
MNLDDYDFTWYAETKRDGEITFCASKKDLFKTGILYAPLAIRERLMHLKGAQRVCASLELSLGPVGIINPELYKEFSKPVEPPFKIRLICMCWPDGDDLPDSWHKKAKELQDWMIEQWEKTE